MQRFSYFSAASAAGAVTKKVAKAGKKVAEVGAETIDTAAELAALRKQLSMVEQTATRAHDTARAGVWGKVGPALEAVGLATLPLGLAPMFIKSADTRALENMREEERIRQKMGLRSLPMTDKLAEQMKQLPSKQVNKAAQTGF